VPSIVPRRARAQDSGRKGGHLWCCLSFGQFCDQSTQFSKGTWVPNRKVRSSLTSFWFLVFVLPLFTCGSLGMALLGPSEQQELDLKISLSLPALIFCAIRHGSFEKKKGFLLLASK
jgi:hypothetical protein